MSRPSKLVLLVDDEATIRDRFTKALESDQTSEFAYQVETAQTRPEALEKAQKMDYCLVITDMELAGNNDDSGFRLAIEMNQRNIPVIAMTRTFMFAKMRKRANAHRRARRRSTTTTEFNLYDKANFNTAPNSLAELAEVTIKGRTVFIAHGHDHAVLKEVKEFVESLKCKPVVLQKLPNLGKSILDKLHAYSNVRFTIVLMTPDDVGGERLDGVVDYRIDRDPEAPARLDMRARQNVIFELGYFIGKHGSSRVCALVVDGIEKPSNYGDILHAYYRPDQDDWKEDICSEMQRAGLDVKCP